MHHMTARPKSKDNGSGYHSTLAKDLSIAKSTQYAVKFIKSLITRIRIIPNL